MSAVTIRLALSEDVAQVVEVERAIATAPHWGEEVYREIVADAGAGTGAVRRCLYVACADGKVVGFAVGRVVAGEGEIESVAVGETMRRRGLGRLLLDAVLGWCRGGGAGMVELEVRAGGEAARRLYGEIGFVETGRRRGYYEEPREDAVLMRLGLRFDDGRE